MENQRISVASSNEEAGAGEAEEADEARAWGLLLRERREATGLSRGQLAERSAISVDTIKNVETGRHIPTRVTRSQLAAALDLEPDLAAPKGGAAPSLPNGVDASLSLNCWLTPDF